MKSKLLPFIALFLLCCSFGGADEKTPLLQATITIVPEQPYQGANDRVQPGTPAFIKATIKNVGEASNAEGTLSIRFALPKALARFSKGPSYESEPEPIPALKPGQEVEITFKTPQQMPGLSEFVKNDWASRLYEAVARFGADEYVIGSGTVTFSAYYYSGPGKPLPKAVPK